MVAVLDDGGDAGGGDGGSGGVDGGSGVGGGGGSAIGGGGGGGGGVKASLFNVRSSDVSNFIMFLFTILLNKSFVVL